MDMIELETRITRIEDIEAIKQLKARYCQASDDNHNPDSVAATFVEDGIWDGGSLGTAQGQEAIRELFRGFQKSISFSQHNIMNPIIDVVGPRATGIWYLHGPFTFHENHDTKLFTLRYDDDYVKVNGEWKHQHLRATLRLSTALS